MKYAVESYLLQERNNYSSTMNQIVWYWDVHNCRGAKRFLCLPATENTCSDLLLAAGTVRHTLLWHIAVTTAINMKGGEGGREGGGSWFIAVGESDSSHRGGGPNTRVWWIYTSDTLVTGMLGTALGESPSQLVNRPCCRDLKAGCTSCCLFKYKIGLWLLKRNWSWIHGYFWPWNFVTLKGENGPRWAKF